MKGNSTKNKNKNNNLEEGAKSTNKKINTSPILGVTTKGPTRETTGLCIQGFALQWSWRLYSVDNVSFDSPWIFHTHVDLKMYCRKKSSSPSSTLQSNGVVAVESTTERQAKTRPTKKFYQNTRRHHELPASNQLQEVIKSIREREREASYSHVADASE